VHKRHGAAQGPRGAQGPKERRGCTKGGSKRGSEKWHEGRGERGDESFGGAEEELRSLVECPICMELMQPPIRQVRSTVQYRFMQTFFFFFFFLRATIRSMMMWRRGSSSLAFFLLGACLTYDVDRSSQQASLVLACARKLLICSCTV